MPFVMLNDSHLAQWFGLPVVSADNLATFRHGEEIYRLGYSYDDEEKPAERLERLLTSPGIEKTTALVLGMDDEHGSEAFGLFLPVLEAHSDRLPLLKGLFLGDVIQEENEMSWIKQCDISCALDIFPGLTELRSRGQDGLAFSPSRHGALIKLVVETGGMPKEVLRGIAGSDLPNLEHLELWLGTEEYGFDGTLGEVLPFLGTGLFPKLRHLTLGNSELQNEIAVAAAVAPILQQLESLDLSLGVLRDAGAEALLKSPGIRGLKKLNLHRNYLSTSMVERFQEIGVEVDTGGQENPDKWNDEEHFYVAVGE